MSLIYIIYTVVKKKNDSLWYCQFHACATISHKNIVKTLNIKPLMNDLQCNEFYNVVIDAVLTLYGADIVWVRAGQIY